MRYIKHLTLFCLLIGTIAVSSATTPLVERADISPQPLQIGEKLTYAISWKKIPAGRRTDWIAKEETLDGASVYHIRSEMKTRALFRFYSFRNQQETYLNPATLSPVHFRNQVQDRNTALPSQLIFERVRHNMKRLRSETRSRRKNARQKL